MTARGAARRRTRPQPKAPVASRKIPRSVAHVCAAAPTLAGQILTRRPVGPIYMQWRSVAHVCAAAGLRRVRVPVHFP